MNRYEIKQVLQQLAMSQGMYGRLLDCLEDNDDAWDYLEKQNFKSALDIVMFIEN